jgi:uncharacterized phiE125 gp8 family phage protein
MLYEEPIGQYLARTQAAGVKSAVMVPRLQVTVPAASDPVTVDELKLYLRIDGNSEDAGLCGLISSATSQAEAWTGRAFVTRTIKTWFDRCPDGPIIELPLSPVSAVTAVTSYNDAGTAAVLAATVYQADIYGEPARICLHNAQSWPTDLRSANAVCVEYICGYGEAEAVPDGIKEAIKALAAHAYEGRGDQKMADASKTLDGAPALVREILRPFAVLRLGD